MSRVHGSRFLGRNILLAFMTAATAGVLAPASNSQAHQGWIRHYGTPVSDHLYDVANDGAGSLYAAGATLYGSSFSTATLLKYDLSGNFLWSKEYGVSDLRSGLGVAADGVGNVYLAGSYTKNGVGELPLATLSKYGASGTEIWSRQLDSWGSDSASAVAVDASGNVFISGTTNGDLGGANNGFDDAFLSKYDASGTLLWTRQFGAGAYDYGLGVAVDGAGNAYLTGSVNGNLFGVGSDAFVNKYDASGSILWTRQLGTAGQDESSGVAVDGNGNVYLAGATSGALGGPSAGASDAFLSKFDADGTSLWTQQIGTAGVDLGLDVSIDGAGNAYLSGSTEGSLQGANAGGSDAFVSKFNGAGSLLWLRQLGSVSGDNASGVAPDGAGGAIIVGSTFNLGGPWAGEVDAYVARVIPEPGSASLALLGIPLSLVVRRLRRRGQLLGTRTVVTPGH